MAKKKKVEQRGLENARAALDDMLTRLQKEFDFRENFAQFEPALILPFFKMFATTKKGLQEAIFICFFVKSRLTADQIKELVMREGHDTTEPYNTLTEMESARMIVKYVHSQNMYGLTERGWIKASELYTNIKLCYEKAIKYNLS